MEIEDSGRQAFMAVDFSVTPEQELWLKRKMRQKGKDNKRLYAHVDIRQLLIDQKGQCQFSKVEMLFDPENGTPGTGKGAGCHPLYASIDHIKAGDPHGGFQIVCYGLNDLKGHLPAKCFEALRKTAEWASLMEKWKKQAQENPQDKNGFSQLLRPDNTPLEHEHATD